MATPQQNANAAAAKAQQANMMARQLVLDRAINMWQPVAGNTLTGPVPGQVVNIPVRNVGLIKRFVLELSFTLTPAAAEVLTRTQFGPANVLSNVTFSDLSNQTRINTTGWHLNFVGTARRQMAYGAAFLNDCPINYGSNWPIIVAPQEVIAAQTVRMFYEIPLAYSDLDLRGSVYAAVVNATMNLQFTVNPLLVAGSGESAVTSAYQSSTANDRGAITNFSWTLYQNYLDQIPQSSNGPILPIQDLSSAYLLNNTAVGALNVNQDNPVPYANFRNFMSTFLIYDNAGTLNTGSDISYFSIQSANYTNIQKTDPYLQSLFARQQISDDFPKGVYYFDHRVKPINTIQYGNMQLIVNPTVVTGATSQLLMGYEAIALINQITQAGSLYGV